MEIIISRAFSCLQPVFSLGIGDMALILSMVLHEGWAAVAVCLWWQGRTLV